MKTISIIAPVRSVKTTTAVACLSFTLLHGIQAQSVDALQSLSSNSQSADSAQGSVETTDIEQLKSKPSRFAVGNVGLYTSARSATFYMADKKMDAFGLFQDPTFRPPTPKNTTATIKKGPSHIAAKPLSEIVKGIKVSTIMIKEKSFLVGVRSFKQGQEFAISYDEGRTKRLQVTRVDPGEITFRDLDSNEEAKLKIDVLPLGMSAGDERLKPAGMVSPDVGQPLILETE